MAILPPLNPFQKREYIEWHLFDALRYLLAAATEWSIQDHLKLQIGGYEVQVYAMDSTFLRARTLFEFFLKKTGHNYYGYDQYIGAPLISSNYANWEGPLHGFSIHFQDRSRPIRLKSRSDGNKDLNQMPVDFALEILDLWKDFEKELRKSSKLEDQELYELARDKRREAIESAAKVVTSDVAKQHAFSAGGTLQPIFAF